mmetsp:Transcript_92143/g.223680  ORF Transcript_92143/g.223680 Transcript_92143/m.223680 type:complete len:116 (+) Transcript_92143:1239-1586(+)
MKEALYAEGCPLSCLEQGLHRLASRFPTPDCLYLHSTDNLSLMMAFLPLLLQQCQHVCLSAEPAAGTQQKFQSSFSLQLLLFYLPRPKGGHKCLGMEPADGAPHQRRGSLPALQS